MNKNGWGKKITHKKDCVLLAQSRSFWLFLIRMYTSAMHLQTYELTDLLPRSPQPCGKIAIETNPNEFSKSQTRVNKLFVITNR